MNIIEQWPDGKKYRGEYENDKKHGKGMIIYPDGSKFEGNFMRGQLHGEGIQTKNGV